MREHMGLFRGKRIDNGEWVEGYLVIADGRINPSKAYILLTASDFSHGDNGNRIRIGCFVEVDPDTVGECTGLTDKNGKLIFEGDILRVYSEESGIEADGFCVVRFGRFKDTDAMSDFDHLGWYITFTTIPKEATTIFTLEEVGIAFEVIGNIHDNPELLKDGEAICGSTTLPCINCVPGPCDYRKGGEG